MEVSAHDASYALSDRPEALNQEALLNVLKLACERIRDGGGKGAT